MKFPKNVPGQTEFINALLLLLLVCSIVNSSHFCTKCLMFYTMHFVADRLVVICVSQKKCVMVMITCLSNGNGDDYISKKCVMVMVMKKLQCNGNGNHYFQK